VKHLNFYIAEGARIHASGSHLKQLVIRDSNHLPDIPMEERGFCPFRGHICQGNHIN
jgi:hypothetical protein